MKYILLFFFVVSIFLPTAFAQDDSLVYLKAIDAKASSFDQTPDWAPAPNPMAPVDSDMNTRWSSDYGAGEQWIYFDMGETVVLSEVAVHWENAFATDYMIQGSDDAQTWQELAREREAGGGTMITAFPPASCRYIKILGLKRVNPSWGISIWETECYGPADKNPNATMTKKDYLSGVKIEDKTEEAKALVDQLASPVVPISEQPFQHGVVYTSWSPDELGSPVSDITLAYIKEVGFDTVAIMIPGYQEQITSTEIYTKDCKGGDTPTMESIAHAIKTCHTLGLRVLLKPHVDPRSHASRTRIVPSDEWFNSYEEFIYKYAELAAEHQVEIFSVGTELEATTYDEWKERWTDIISQVRDVYSGIITYSANWTEYEHVSFWEDIDIIGIDAYFPLTPTNNPTLNDLVWGWNYRASKIDKWLKEEELTDKGVFFTEIGYPSVDGANRRPWKALTTIEDQQEQADSLLAMVKTMTRRPWFKGYYIWQYFPQDRWSPLGFTIREKKAEEVLKKWIGETKSE